MYWNVYLNKCDGETIVFLWLSKSYSTKVCFFSGCEVPTCADVDHGWEDQNNIDGNTGYTDIATAWEQCGNIAECAFVMKHCNDKYYLRHANDMVHTPNPGCRVEGYTYRNCGKKIFFLGIFSFSFLCTFLLYRIFQ